MKLFYGVDQNRASCLWYIQFDGSIQIMVNNFTMGWVVGEDVCFGNGFSEIYLRISRIIEETSYHKSTIQSVSKSIKI